MLDQTLNLFLTLYVLATKLPLSKVYIPLYIVFHTQDNTSPKTKLDKKIKCKEILQICEEKLLCFLSIQFLAIDLVYLYVRISFDFT